MKKKCKILLLFPPYFISPEVCAQGISLEDIYAPLPVGLLSVASYLKQSFKDADVRVVPMFAFFTGAMRAVNDGKKESYIKFSYSIKSVLDYLLREFPADAVGISTMVAVDEYATAIIVNILRKYYPHVKIIIGGNHATFNAVKLLQSHYAPDVVVLGEGEKVFKDLVGAKLKYDGMRMKGIAYRMPSGEIFTGGLPPLLSEEEISCPLDYDLLWLPGNTRSVSKLDSNAMYGRGCIFKCSFCTSPVMWQGMVRYKSVRLFEREIKCLIERGAKHITLWDDIINQSKFHFSTLCRSLSKFSGIGFTAMIRLGMLPEKELMLLKKSNVKFLDFGVETLDPVVLKRMNKSQNLKLLRDTCTRIVNAGIHVKVNIMFGHPGSNYASDVRTIEQLKLFCEEGLIYEVYGSIFMPIRGVEAAVDSGFRGVESNMAKWNCKNAVCEIVDAAGSVTYSKDQIEAAYHIYLKDIVGTLKQKHRDSYRAVSAG